MVGSDNFHIVEGADPHGITREFIGVDGKVITKDTYDAEPFLEAAAQERAATDGQRWGEMRKIGIMPMAEYAKYLFIRDNKERQKYLLNWLRENPKLVTFNRFLLP